MICLSPTGAQRVRALSQLRVPDLIFPIATPVVIQNTTFGGIQGFTRKPSTEWFADGSSEPAGIVHQERNWTYVLFFRAGHLVPQYQPSAAYTFLREFVLGSNKTGLVIDAGTPAVGGEDPGKYGATAVPAGPEIYLGSLSTTSTYIAPSSVRATWESFYATITTAATSGSVTHTELGSSASSTHASGNGAEHLAAGGAGLFALLCALVLAA
jgi:carboxypeptidase D